MQTGRMRWFLAGFPLILTLSAAPGTSREAVPVASPQSAPAQSGRPNILVVMTDDMRIDELRYMPNVRAHLLSRGVEWRNSFSPYPLCCPARASFLTGRHVHNHRVYSHRKPWGYQAFDDSWTLAGALQRSGYRTAYIGKYLNGYGPDSPKAAPARRHSYTYVPRGWTQWRASPDGSPFRESDPRAGGTYRYFDLSLNVNGRIVGHGGEYSSAVIADNANQVIDRFSKRAGPWFLMVNSVAPHTGGPHEADDPAAISKPGGGLIRTPTPARPDWVKHHFDARIQHSPGVRADGGPAEADVSDKMALTRRLREPGSAEKVALREHARQRAEALFALDRGLGRMFDRLRAVGEYADTILVFTSDNGYLLGEHRWRNVKVLPYEASLRVPLLMAGPSIPVGVVRDAPVSTVDLTATVLDWANAWLASVDGRSVIPDLTSNRGWRHAVLTEGVFPHLRRRLGPSDGFGDPLSEFGVRTARYKFVRYVNGEVELFDLLEDPLELRSVDADPDYASVLQQLVDLWNAYRTCQGVSCRMPLPAPLQTAPDETTHLRVVMGQALRDYYG
jgi:N-acetylglucosamine-6-sulfatase